MEFSDIPNTAFNARLAAGHEIRLGHPLHVVLTSEDGMLWHRVYLCCGQELPTTVPNWEDITPTKEAPTPKEAE